MTPIEAELLVARAVVLVGLYAFIAVVGALAWRELRLARRAPAAGRRVHTARLIVLHGGDSDRAPGTQFPLANVVRIGRDLDNDIVLADPTISSRHALLARHDGAWWIEDLGSRNGVEVNGARLVPTVPFVVRSGDSVGIGGVRARLVCPEDGP